MPFNIKIESFSNDSSKNPFILKDLTLTKISKLKKLIEKEFSFNSKTIVLIQQGNVLNDDDIIDCKNDNETISLFLFEKRNGNEITSTSLKEWSEADKSGNTNNPQANNIVPGVIGPDGNPVSQAALQELVGSIVPAGGNAQMIANLLRQQMQQQQAQQQVLQQAQQQVESQSESQASPSQPQQSQTSNNADQTSNNTEQTSNNTEQTSNTQQQQQQQQQQQPANDNNNNNNNNNLNPNDFDVHLPPINQEILDELLDIGFSEGRAKKALLLNRNATLEEAIEWIGEHQDDDDIDAPLSMQQLQSIGALRPKRRLHVPAPIRTALSHNLCTFTVTGNTFSPQAWYRCHTCRLIEAEGCCESCAKVCHFGHELSVARDSEKFYCDCGAGRASCLAMGTFAPVEF